jgi:hypothetical protein
MHVNFLTKNTGDMTTISINRIHILTHTTHQQQVLHMNTATLFSGINNGDTHGGSTHDSSAAELPETTADGSGNEHDDSEGGDVNSDGENATDGNCFLRTDDGCDEDENEPTPYPDEDDPLRHLFGGSITNENQEDRT